MPTYGPYAKLVQEVLTFFKSGSLLTASKCPSDLEVVVVDEIPKDLCGAGSGGKSPDVLGPKDRSYGDIQELARLRFYGSTPRLLMQWVDGEILFGSDEYLDAIGSRLTPPFYEYAETIAGDLRSAALARLKFGAADGPFERMFQVYRAGGMPCGYVGEYSRAYQLMAVFPGIQTPSERVPQRPTFAQYLFENRGY